MLCAMLGCKDLENKQCTVGVFQSLLFQVEA